MLRYEFYNVVPLGSTILRKPLAKFIDITRNSRQCTYNSERKERFADAIYCISFLCNSSCGFWQLEIFLKLNDYWLI